MLTTPITPPTAAKPKFVDPARSEFFFTLRQRVDEYFAEKNISRYADARMWTKAIFYLVLFAVLLGAIFSNQFGPWTLLGLCSALGVVMALIGFNVSHDAIHGAFSPSARVNKWLGMTFHLGGANPYLWTIAHNGIHHTYTNIHGHDEDINIAGGLVRLDATEPVRPVHRFQHLYAFGLYCLTSFSWMLDKDFRNFFVKFASGPHAPRGGHPKSEVFNLFFFKLAYYSLYLVLPMFVLDVTWWQVLIGFMAMHVAEGLTLALVFQLAHVVEGTDFPATTEAGTIEDSWAAHQLRTTANFSAQSKLAHFLCGGLNQQVEHHLFPKICHTHYPALSRIVARTAEEFNLPYLNNRSFGTALASHYRTLRAFGVEAWQRQQQRQMAA
jgi:linoleoyl-CoA desaturase